MTETMSYGDDYAPLASGTSTANLHFGRLKNGVYALEVHIRSTEKGEAVMIMG